MRLLGTLPEQRKAQLFADYLLTQAIPMKLLEEGGQWELWVQNEDQVDAARELWLLFQANPQDPRFPQAASAAKEIKKKEADAERKWRENFRSAGHLWGRPDPKQVPVTVGLIVISIAVFLYTGMGSPTSPNLHWFTFTDPHRIVSPEDWAKLTGQLPDVAAAQPAFQAVGRLYVYFGTEHIRHGEVWRLLTPIFIHFGFLHLAFNMYALFGLGGLVEYKRGWLWYLAFVITTGVTANVAEYALPLAFDGLEIGGADAHFFGSLFGGMSGVLYALFGYLWMKTTYAPEPGLYLPRDLIWLMLIWLVVCMTGVVGSIANTAHVTGLICGVLIGAGPKLLRTLLKR